MVLSEKSMLNRLSTYYINSIKHQLSNSEVDDCITNINTNNIQIEENDVIDSLLLAELNVNNYEQILFLDYFTNEKQKTDFTEKTQDISYSDIDGNSIASVHIDFKDKKLTVEFISKVFIPQEYKSPQVVKEKIDSITKTNNWSIEYGGINPFNGFIEFRYRNSDNNVAAAVITSPDGKIDTVVEYEYLNGKKKKMIFTSHHGQRVTVYDTTKNSLLIMSVEIDTDGNILRIIKSFEN